MSLTRSTRSSAPRCCGASYAKCQLRATTGRPHVVERLTALCGRHLQALWKIRLTAREAPAVRAWLATGRARLGDLMRDPADREDRLHVVPLLVQRGEEAVLAPDDDFLLAADDELLLAGRPTARRGLDNTLLMETVAEYIVSGRHVPSSWIWRRLTRSED